MAFVQVRKFPPVKKSDKDNFISNRGQSTDRYVQKRLEQKAKKELEKINGRKN